jgi:hypothetical protein
MLVLYLQYSFLYPYEGEIGLEEKYAGKHKTERSEAGKRGN